MAITVFLVKSICCSGLFFLYYQLFLKNRRMHTFNRFFLLGSVLLSLLLPALHFEWNTGNSHTANMAYNLLRVVDAGNEEQDMMVKQQSTIPVSDILAMLYAVVCVVMLILFIYRLAWLNKVRKQGRMKYIDGIKVIYTWDKRAPFSYMDELYWPATMGKDDDAGQKIWAHEMVHIRQRHSLDKLFLQLAIIFFWVNPFYWLIQRECAMLHEFIADEEITKPGDAAPLAMMLLQSCFTGNNSMMLNTFFHSPIKRRIMMVQKNNKLVLGNVRRFLVVPVIAASVFLFSFSANSGKVRAEKKITVLLDAGHGGEDAGGRNAEGIAEKDLNLAIANRIMKMAAGYNIEIIPIRPEDEYVTLTDRVAKANSIKADLMISLHVNSNAEGSRYQLIIDERNKVKDKSQKLASAINTQMQDLGVKPEIYNKHLVVLKGVNMPAVLIECGDINNAEDVKMLTNDSQLQGFCDKILTGIVAYTTSK